MNLVNFQTSTADSDERVGDLLLRVPTRADHVVSLQQLLYRSDGDLRRYLMREGVAIAADVIKDFMVKDPRTIGPDDLVEKALGEMQKKKIGEVPVVDTDGKVLGMLNLKDCLGIK